MVDIAYIVSHGFAARMVTQTGLVKRLRESGKTVALICPDKNDPVLSVYCKQHDIELIEFNERGGFWNENYMFKRKYFLEDIQSNPALMDKHIHATRYNPSLHPIRRIRPFYYWLIYKLIPIFQIIRKKFIKREKKHLYSEPARKLIDDLRPAKLIATYPVNFNEALLLHYGNAHPAVQTWIHLLSWDNITCKGHFAETADNYIAWGSIMKQELEHYYHVKQNHIFVTGVPHFDLHISAKQNPQPTKFISALGIDPTIPYLFFAMSSPRFAPGEIAIVEWLAEAIEAGIFGKMQLVVRPHPQNVKGNLADLKWLPRLRKLQDYNSTAVDFPQVMDSKLNWSMEEGDMVRLANIISGSTLIINSGSTVSIDGLLHAKPIIITAFDGQVNYTYWKSARRLVDYPHLKKLVQLGGVSVVDNYLTFEVMIKKYLNDNDYLATERNNTLLAEIYQPDGKATDRVVEILK